jgi:hypothetical protein
VSSPSLRTRAVDAWAPYCPRSTHSRPIAGPRTGKQVRVGRNALNARKEWPAAWPRSTADAAQLYAEQALMVSDATVHSGHNAPTLRASARPNTRTRPRLWTQDNPGIRKRSSYELAHWLMSSLRTCQALRSACTSAVSDVRRPDADTHGGHNSRDTAAWSLVLRVWTWRVVRLQHGRLVPGQLALTTFHPLFNDAAGTRSVGYRVTLWPLSDSSRCRATDVSSLLLAMDHSMTMAKARSQRRSRGSGVRTMWHVQTRHCRSAASLGQVMS